MDTISNKNHQDANRTKTGEIKKIDFSKNTLPTQTGTSLTRDLKTVLLTEKNANFVRWKNSEFCIIISSDFITEQVSTIG